MALGTGSLLAPNRGSPLNQGLLAWWIVLPGRSGGGRLVDLWGKYHNSLVNGASWIAPQGRPGGLGAIGLNAALSQYISTPLLPPIGANARTFAIWGWYDPANTGVRVLTDWGTTAVIGNRNLLYFAAGDSHPKYEFFGSTLTSSNVTTGGVWNHYCAIYNGTAAALYINGLFAGSASPSLNTAAGPMRIGYSIDNGGPWPGYLDDIRVYNRALSAVEVMALYQESRLGYPNGLLRVTRPLPAAVVGSGIQRQAMHQFRQRGT